MNTQTHPDRKLNHDSWLSFQTPIIANMATTFAKFANNNRDAMKSVQSGAPIATAIFEQITGFLNGTISKHDVAALATNSAKTGLSHITASQMLKSICKTLLPEQVPTSLLIQLNEYQLIFLEALVETREVLHLRAQEESQIALQQAIYSQLEQQRQLRDSVERQSRSLNQILQLNSSLSRAANETELLREAVNGIGQSLNLDHVSIYEKSETSTNWIIRSSTASNPVQVDPTNPQIAELLTQIDTSAEEFVKEHQLSSKIKGLAIVIPFAIDAQRSGALIAVSTNLSKDKEQELPILLRTFAQSLTTMWRNLSLLTETTQRAHELEILQGRYIDSVWGDENTNVQAYFDQEEFRIKTLQASQQSVAYNPHDIPLRIGEHAFGQVSLPNDISLDQENQIFVEELVKEMSTALNNAYLLQTTRAYSNQLQLASEVSRAATTILNPDLLIQETVDLIQSRFNFYYAGLFLVDSLHNMAVLEAGTGEAGQAQVQNNHQLKIGGNSMIGTAIANNEARVEQDVTKAKQFAPNPLLPDTKSELALPLRSHGDVIGALTVQSVEINAFSAETITVLQNLADQLATAITNADLLTQVQTNLAETSRLYESGRKLNETRTRADVYDVLLDFTSQCNLFDFAQLIIIERENPDYLARPMQWSRQKSDNQPLAKLPRQEFPYETQLNLNEIVILSHIELLQQDNPAISNLMASEYVQTIVLIPIFAEGTWLGALSVQALNKLELSEQDLQPLRTLVDQAAITIVNQQLLRQAELLYQIGRSLSQALTRDDALDIAVSEIADYTGAAQCRIILYDEQTHQGQIVAETSPAPQQTTIQFGMEGDFVFDYLNEQRQPLLISETEAEIPADALAQYATQFGAVSALLVPLASQQDLIGFLSVEAPSKRPFTTNNIIFSQTVVDHLTTHLENLKLLDEALTRAQELIFLNQIQANISSILDVKQLALTTYQQIGRLLNTSMFLMAQYEQETNKFEPILSIIQNKEQKLPIPEINKDSALHQFLKDDLPIITDATHPLHKIFPEFAESQSGIWVPFQRENTPSGLICVLSTQPRAYQENDSQLLRSIATQAGLAIENARLFEQIQENIEDLRQLDDMKNQFLANMSHELRTPLNSIIGFSRVILKGIDGPLTQEQEEDLTSIYNNGQHLLSLINEILDMAKIEAGKMNLSFEQVDLGQAAQATLSDIRSLIRPNVQIISDIANDLPTIEADPLRIRQILINLLSNSAKFTIEGHISLKVSQESEKELLVTVSDTGLGIKEEDLDKLFIAFEQIDNSTTRTAGGTGLGLPITLWLVRMHNGNLSLETDYGKGTTIFVRLPLVQPEEQPVVAFNT